MDNGRLEVDMNRTLGFFLVVATAAACRSTAPPPTVSTAASATPTPPATASPTPEAAGIPEAIRWVRDSAEHRAIFIQVYREAAQLVEQESTRLTPGTWAVALDGDETVIDNSAYEVDRAEKHLPFDEQSWRAWTASRRATALPGAAAFLGRVRGLGGRIAIVTNRTESECPDTEAQFRELALPFDVMLCKPNTGPGAKKPRFEAIARGTTPAGLPPLHIVAFLGDNILDFPNLSQAIVKGGDDAFAEFGVHFFILPNPMYGSWQ